MLRRTGWPLAIIISSPLLLQKSVRNNNSINNNNSTSTLTESSVIRHIGTVTSFKHRRGYGFLREIEQSFIGSTATPTPATLKKKKEEYKPATEENASSSVMERQYFFPRSSLDGGFYVAEGQTVAFDVQLVRPSKGLTAHLAVAKAKEEETNNNNNNKQEEETARELSVAKRIRVYDAVAGRERPVTPVMLFGVVDAWDPLAGTGAIAELDLSGELHADAPRFTVALEDLDLGGRAELRRGRYVRFCIEAGDRHAARRVIIDRGAERKHAAQRNNNINKDNNNIADISGASLSYGTVRETVEGRFGFILLDGSGESLFFHMSNTIGGVKPGDTVSFVLREVGQGKHAGKRTCLQVQKCTTRPSTTAGNNSINNNTNNNSSQGARGIVDLDDDDDEFELLD